jgi:ribonuclease-3
MDMTKLESRLGYVFRDRTLVRRALTHPSYVLKDREPDNQRLEFLGDAVLQLSVSQALYRRYPEMKEGKLTRRRAALVCEANLAGIARRLGLGGQLLLSNGEELLHGRENPSILGDAMEAVIAAVYLDGGFPAAVSLVERLMGDFEPISTDDKDAKSILQEMLQARGEAAPVYEIIDQQGPPHARVFTARALRGSGEEIGRGTGDRKQRAEEAAAAAALAALKENS